MLCSRSMPPLRPLLVAMLPAMLGCSVAVANEPTVLVAPEPTETLAPVVVKGGSIFSATESEAIRPSQVLEGAELQRRQAGSIGETLDGLPGISNADFGPGVGRPVIRGLTGSRVAILEDGLRTSDISGEGVDHAVASDPLRGETIEMIRGPATLLYGSGAVGGVVNVVTGRFSPAIGSAISGNVAASYGENGHDRSGYAGLEVPFSEQFALRADVSKRKAGDFSIKGFQQADGGGKKGDLINSDLDTQSLSVTGMFSNDQGFLGLGYTRWESEYGIPEVFDARPRNMGGQENEYERIFADSDRFDVRGEWYEPFNSIRSIRLNMAYTQFHQDEKEFEYSRTPSGGELDDIEIEAVFKQDEFDTRLEVTHDTPWDGAGVVGFDLNLVDFTAEGDEGEDFFIRPNDKRGLGLFTVQNIPASFGGWELGLRLGHERFDPDAIHDPSLPYVDINDRRVDFQTDPGTRDFNLISAAGAAMIDLDDQHELQLRVSRSEASPGPEQLYAFGRHGAAGTFEVGNPDLSKETYLNTEITLSRETGAIRYDLTAFFNWVDDFVYFGFTPGDDGGALRVDADGNPDASGDLLVENRQQDARFYGLELNAASDIQAGGLPVTLRMSADYLRGELSGGENLPRMTPPRVGVGFDTQWRQVGLSVDYRRVFKQTRTAEAETPTDGYNLLGFDLNYQPASTEDLTLFLRGRNLTNDAGRLHQSFFKERAPIVGRAFTAGVRYAF